MFFVGAAVCICICICISVSAAASTQDLEACSPTVHTFAASREGGQNMDWSSTFDAALGLEALPAPLIQKLAWRTDEQLANVLRTLDEDGAVLLDAVMDAPEAQSMRAYYYDRFLPAVDD